MLDTANMGEGGYACVNTTPWRRNSVVTLLASIGPTGFTLYPLQGLFGCARRGYLAEFPAQNHNALPDHPDGHNACIRSAARSFLDSPTQGELFIDTPLRTLLNRDFRFRLNQFMRQNPCLNGRLTLLLQADELHALPAASMQINPVCHGLSLAGVQFGLHLLRFDQQAWINCPEIHDISPCVVVHYHDTLTQDRGTIQSLATIIRHCRSSGWPLLADFRDITSPLVSR